MKISFVGAGNVASSLGSLFAHAGHLVKYGTPNPKESQLSVAEEEQTQASLTFSVKHK